MSAISESRSNLGAKSKAEPFADDELYGEDEENPFK